jgi:predicted GNAT family acetyltransferase
MQLVKPETFGEFRHLAEDFLLAHEAEHGLIYGIASIPKPPDAYCALVVDNGRVVAAVIRTISKMVVSREDTPGAMAIIAEDAIADPGLHGILGPLASLESFVRGSKREWTRGRGTTIYLCDRVQPPVGVIGQRHIAMAADRALLTEWIEAFHAEAMNSGSRGEAEAAADRYISSGTMHLWLVDQRPVACAAVVGPSPHAIRIGPVYTPPEHRRRGYASALVADLSCDQLGRGKTFTYLYADRENETANSIYQKIGYRAVAECDEMWLA